jgi:cation transport protein ChaC
MAARPVSLTADHVARVHRVVADGGPPAGVDQQTDADYADWVAKTIARHPAPDRPIQLFAYGSLIWKPEVEHRGERPGVARGIRDSGLWRLQALLADEIDRMGAP